MVAGLFLAAGLVTSSALATATWLKVRNSQFVTVKGSARKNIESDLVIWTGAFSVEAPSLLEAQRELKTDLGKVAAFLNHEAVTNFEFTSIAIEEEKATLKDSAGGLLQKTAGYRLTQTVRVESGDIERMVSLDRDSTALVEEGVLFATQTPQFIYTKAAEAKIEMLAEATKDARDRAEQISGQGGRHLSRLHSAEMGVFQITPLNAGQTSWEGVNDTSSRKKTITAVVTATFALE